ncbi:unnamed protein product [marine sediment metagenome]|uniref:Uncharacterized protein n=1 Tax=marine sediment metagenome TaxID=412755 RepID=X0WKW9_9ZZZZ
MTLEDLRKVTANDVLDASQFDSAEEEAVIRSHQWTKDKSRCQGQQVAWECKKCQKARMQTTPECFGGPIENGVRNCGYYLMEDALG